VKVEGFSWRKAKGYSQWVMPVRHALLLLLLLPGLLCPSGWAALDGSPQPAGAAPDSAVLPMGYGGGGRFTALAVDPRNPDLVLAGSDVAGVFQSRDGGNTFQLKGKGLEGFAVADIAFHPAPPARLFLLTGDGLYLSADDGENWLKKSDVIRYPARFFGSHLLVFWKDALWAATDHNGVFQLHDRDLELSIEPTSGLEGTKVNALTSSRDHLFAATSRGVYRYARGGPWQSYSHGLEPSHCDIMDIARHVSGHLYLLERHRGVHVLDEKQHVWRRTTLPPAVTAHAGGYKALAPDPADPQRILVATHPENWPHCLMQTRNGGRSWNAVGVFEPSPDAPEHWARGLNGPERIVFTSRPGEVYLVDWWNVWKSVDGGAQWRQLHHGLQNTVVNAIRVHPQRPQRIFLCTADNGVMASEDGGRHWQRKMAGVVDGHAQGLEFSAQDPQKMFLIMNPWEKRGRVHVYRSADGSESWHDIGFPAPSTPLPGFGFVDGAVTNLAVDPTDDRTLYVGTNGYGVFKTVNGGKDWVSANDGLATPFIKGPRALLIHPRKPQVLLASTQQGGIYQSLDGAKTWHALNTGGAFTFGMAFAPRNPSRIIAACAEKRLLVSEDEGNTWQTVDLPGERPPYVAAYVVAWLPLCPQTIVVGTLAYDYRAAGGLYISDDAGASFRQYPMDLPRVNVLALEALPEADCRVWLGSNGIGLHQVRLRRPAAGSMPETTDERVQ